MPYHYGKGKHKAKKSKSSMKKKKEEKIMVKVASIKNIIQDLKPRQQKTMRSHARHHTLKHMKAMARYIKNGATFFIST